MVKKKVEITISSSRMNIPGTDTAVEDTQVVSHTDTLDTSCPSMLNSWVCISSSAVRTWGSAPESSSSSQNEISRRVGSRYWEYSDGI